MTGEKTKEEQSGVSKVRGEREEDKVRNVRKRNTRKKNSKKKKRGTKYRQGWKIKEKGGK